MKRICVFCGSSVGARPAYVQTTRALGGAIASRGLTLVYGGGNIGLMGVLADAVLNRGGRVIGIIPQALVDKELAHRGLTELRIVHSMHERKALMADLADAFVALPGGYGTLEEFCEVVTWSQLGLHRKPCGLLNTEGFYDAFLSQINRAVADQFIRSEQRGLVEVAESPEALLDRLAQSHLPPPRQWIAQDET